MRKRDFFAVLGVMVWLHVRLGREKFIFNVKKSFVTISDDYLKNFVTRVYFSPLTFKIHDNFFHNFPLHDFRHLPSFSLITTRQTRNFVPKTMPVILSCPFIRHRLIGRLVARKKVAKRGPIARGRIISREEGKDNFVIR